MSSNHQQIKSDLVLPWVITGTMFFMLLVYLAVCLLYGECLQQNLAEEQRVIIRTVFYICAILAFPMTNLIRHIQIRLNETMPSVTTAKSRYLFTIIVSMVLVDSIGFFGLIMFLLGDGFNTLYIFIGMSVLGLYLYRPKEYEYIKIVEALTLQKKG
jgi:hypothetical protein